MTLLKTKRNALVPIDVVEVFCDCGNELDIIMTEEDIIVNPCSFCLEGEAEYAYDNGYNQGYETREEEGFEDAFNEGREEGYREGFDEGEVEGYEKAKEEYEQG